MLAEAHLTFKESECHGVLTLEGPVRQLLRQSLQVDNPFDRRSVFQCVSSHPDLVFNPQPLHVPPRGSAVLELSLRGQVVGEGEATVTLSSEELGVLKYLLAFRIRDPGVEKRVTFSMPLGRDVQQAVRFLYFGKKSAVFQVALEAAAPSGEGLSPRAGAVRASTGGGAEAFALEAKTVQTSPDADGQGVEFSVPVRFSPSRLQEAKAMLCARSADGQEYKVGIKDFAGNRFGRQSRDDRRSPAADLHAKSLVAFSAFRLCSSEWLFLPRRRGRSAFPGESLCPSNSGTL